jgi:hypothetical protein
VSSADLATLARCLRASYERRTESTDWTPRWLPEYLSSPPEASTAGVKVSAGHCLVPGARWMSTSATVVARTQTPVAVPGGYIQLRRSNRPCEGMQMRHRERAARAGLYVIEGNRRVSRQFVWQEGGRRGSGGGKHDVAVQALTPSP